MTDILSPYIIAAVCGWVVAQLLKYVINSIRKGGLKNPRQLYLSGGMPSAHSATVTALAVVIAVKDGLASPLFALALTFAAVVIYDAMMVRRSSGEQGKALTALLKEQKSVVPLPRVAKGHTPVEVMVGIALGVAIGLAVCWLLLVK